MTRVIIYINDFLQKIKPVDIIDMAFIASFIYFILIGVRRTRVRFIFAGIVFVGLVYIAARILGLYLTSIALQAFFAVFMVVMVIIFQDELRHLFERLAILGIFRNRTTKKNIPFNSCVEVLSSALAALSRKRTGALLVIKGNDPIERYLEAGKEVDALLGHEILEGIFHPETPTHDGAVIIAEERIVKFGCHLPLSTNIQEVGRSGTRHAAGVGLSERTDALCLIVSEETGAISAAENGRLTHINELAQLKDRLRNFYLRRFAPQKRTGFLNILAAHSLEKVIAILLAIGLWFAFAHPGEIVRRYFTVPIEYRNLATDIVIKEPKLKEATVTLSGTEQKFNLLNPKNFKLSLDASQIKDGENKIALSSDLIKGVTGGVSIMDIEPDQVVLNAYKLRVVSVAVSVSVEGNLPASLSLKEIKIVPRQVEVLLPSTISKEGLFINTEPINLSMINETVSLKPNFISSDDIRFKDNKLPEITVTIEVEKIKDAQ
ncbi:MAG: diadenylate cyclase CdaA [Candidatus Omnitrophota bacterium]|nr:diadenylate cyclase CdaA [Candidatus Omnitrophota bacterium]